MYRQSCLIPILSIKLLLRKFHLSAKHSSSQRDGFLLLSLQSRDREFTPKPDHMHLTFVAIDRSRGLSVCGKSTISKTYNKSAYILAAGSVIFRKSWYKSLLPDGLLHGVDRYRFHSNRTTTSCTVAV